MTTSQVIVLMGLFALVVFLVYGVYWALIVPTTWRRRAARVCVGFGVGGYLTSTFAVVARDLPGQSGGRPEWLGSTVFLIIGGLLWRRANRMDAGELRDREGLIETDRRGHEDLTKTGTGIPAVDGPRDVSRARYLWYWLTGR